MKFDKKTLPKEVQDIIALREKAWGISNKLEYWIDKNNCEDINVWACFIHYEWLCPPLTGFDEDYIAAGEVCLMYLDKILAQDPQHEEAEKLKKSIGKRVKKAKKDQAAILVFDKEDIYSLDIEIARELAYYHHERASNDKARAEKAYLLWERCYKEIPDSFTHKELTNIVLDGNNLFYLSLMAESKYYAAGLEAALPIIDKLADWAVLSDIKTYDFSYSAGVWLKLLYLSEQDKLQDFQQLFWRWIDTVQQARNEYVKFTNSDFLYPVGIWLLEKKQAKELAYLLEHCYGALNKSVLQDRDKQLIKNIEAFLNS